MRLPQIISAIQMQIGETIFTKLTKIDKDVKK